MGEYYLVGTFNDLSLNFYNEDGVIDLSFTLIEAHKQIMIYL